MKLWDLSGYSEKSNIQEPYLPKTSISTYVQKCMQWRKWRNWRKIASRWRFELDAKSGPLEAGDFGENGNFGDFGKNRQRAGDMWQNIQIGCQKWYLQSR